jgi:hypothetical protein
MQSCVDFSSYRLYEPGFRGGPRIVGLISREKGERMVRNQTAETGVDWDGKTLCFFSKAAKQVKPLVSTRPSQQIDVSAEASNTAFSRAEVDAIAGTKFRYGGSRTIEMTEEARSNRTHPVTHRVLPPEDLIERATNKFNAWQQLGPALQELVRVGDVAAL